MDPVKAEAAAAAIEEALSRFPADLPRIAGVEKVYVCENLTSLGVPSPAAAIQEGSNAFIYVDALTARRTGVSFTHELFHALEFRFPVDDETWAGINPLEPYLKDLASPGDVVPYTPNMIPAFEPGFATDYSRFSAAEDRAELFTLLYSGKELTAKERTALLNDSILLEKIEFLKTYLGECGVSPEGMKDSLLDVDTIYTCRVYRLIDPGRARTGPGEAYPGAMLKAGDLLADSGFERDGVKMLYDENFRRVYAPSETLESADGESRTFSHPSSSLK